MASGRKSGCTLSFVTSLLLGFLLTNLVSVTYVSVFYHRGFSHRALTLSPGLRRFVLATGFWVTGVDPKGWTVLHRMHHRHSTTELDPHHPDRADPISIGYATVSSYLGYLSAIRKGDKALARLAADVDFGVPSWLAVYGFFLPLLGWISYASGVYALTGNAGLALGCFFGLDFIFKTWVANGLGHSVGYRNYDTPDTSTNNHWAVWLIGGENYHNNHHRYPSRAHFAHRPGELDPAYHIARGLQALGLLTLEGREPVSEPSPDPATR